MFDVQPLLQRVHAQEPIAVAEGMKLVLDGAAHEQPHPSWTRLAAYDWESDLPRLTEWCSQLLRIEPPSPGIRVFYFGLFEPVENGRSTTELYLAGYSLRDGAVQVVGRGDWWPAGRYSGSRALRVMHEEAYARPECLENDIEYPVGLTYALLVARHLATRIEPALWLRQEPQCDIAAGFDEGDIFEIGQVTPRGFQASGEIRYG